MNKILISIGIACSVLWALVTAMTFGLPMKLCQILDKTTFGLFSKEVLQMANGFYYDTNNNDMPTIMFLVVFWIIFVLVFWAMKKVENHSCQKHSLVIVVFFSILFRLIILPSVPIHENDIYRYLWDGKSFVHGINPYKYAPSDLFMYEEGMTQDYYDSYRDVTLKARSLSEEDRRQLYKLINLRDGNPVFYNRIGHWQVPTIYPPVAELVFWLSALLRQDSLVFMKFLFVLFDIGVLFFIIALLKHLNKNPCLSLIYGWSPLVLKEIPNAGHYDSIPIFFTMASLYFFVKGKRWYTVATLALATLSKFFSGVLLPLLTGFVKKRQVIAFGLLIILFYVPFFLWDQTGVKGVFQGLMTYNKEWSYNSSVFALIYIFLEHFWPNLTEGLLPSKVFAGLLYIGILIGIALQKDKSDLAILHKCFLALAILFMISPVGDPWYFCWTMPFLCIFPYRSWLMLSGLLMLSYLNFHSDIDILSGRFLNIPIMSWIIYVPFFIILWLEAWFKPKFAENGCKDNGK